jgi:hypothetical protein
MTELEVRGFLVTGCSDCAFAAENPGAGRDYNGIEYYYCKLSGKQFENPDWDDRYMSGVCNSIPKGFATFCRLKPIKDRHSRVMQKYKRVVKLLNDANAVIKE